MDFVCRSAIEGEKKPCSAYKEYSVSCLQRHTNFPTSGELEDGASRRERDFGGGKKSIFAGEKKCVELGVWDTYTSRKVIWRAC